METAIAAWGNSEAVRIPRDVLRQAGLRRGDRVGFAVNELGRVELVPHAREHRRVGPARGVTYESLFKGYESAVDGVPAAAAWPDDELEGAEWEAWAR